jgi:peptidyl-prolyl cis-trans isomerase C
MRVKLSTVAAVAVISAALFAASHNAIAKEAVSNDPVVATVNGDKIMKKDVTDALQSLPQLQGADVQQIFPRIVDQIITEKLLSSATKKAHVQDTPEFKKRLDIVQSQLAKQLYVEEFLKDKITDAQIKSEYEKFKKSNAGKEEVRARQILVSTEEEAKQVIKDLDGGAKFEDLAKQRSSGPSAQNGGEIPGYFVKEEMIPEISNAAFALKPGTYTKEPVKSQFGWHVLKLEDKRPRNVPDFKDVEMAIRNKLGQDALSALSQDLRSKADIKLFDMNGKPLEEEKNKN